MRAEKKVAERLRKSFTLNPLGCCDQYNKRNGRAPALDFKQQEIFWIKGQYTPMVADFLTLKRELKQATPGEVSGSSRFGRNMSLWFSALKACSTTKDLERGKRVHADAVEAGVASNVYISNTLIDMYAKCGSMVDASRVFCKMHRRTVTSWNALLMGYAHNGNGEMALQLYGEMHERNECVPDRVTYLAALKACTSLVAEEESDPVKGKLMKARCLLKGRSIHFQIGKSGLQSDVFIESTLIDMYAKCGNMTDAKDVFSKMQRQVVVAWNAMILGYAQNGEGEAALELYAQMHDIQDFAPDRVTFLGALKACASMVSEEDNDSGAGKAVCLEKGRAIHSEIAKSGLESETHITSTLIDMYAKCGSIEDAWNVFGRMQHKDVVSWNALIMGYARNGDAETALQLYARMDGNGGCAPSARTFAAALMACSSVAALETGRKVHTQIFKCGFQGDIVLANCLVDFYGKCGNMVDAQQVFDTTTDRNVKTWTVLIAGYSLQGNTKQVFDLFQRMQDDGVQADGITFLHVLTACSHTGLVDKGKEYFHAMSSYYKISPTIEHYTCMVHILSRANHLDEAVAIVKNMPFRPDAVIWTAMLGACRKWGNVVVGRFAFESLLQLDEKDATSYVLMSSIYRIAGMNTEMVEVERMRRQAQASNKRGDSRWTDDGGRVHKFVDGDITESLYELVKKVLVKMDMNDNVQENELCGHSEKLATAFAITNTGPGKPIRIVKSLQVCYSCHKSISLISRSEKRTIVCRDSHMIHVFKDGNCSCEAEARSDNNWH